MDWTLRRCSLLPTTKRSTVCSPKLWLVLRCVLLPRYRLDMINWSTKIREEDYTYFCKAAVNKYEADRSAAVRSVSLKEKLIFVLRFAVWIVSDCRRETDVQYFQETYGSAVATIRIVASDQARTER